MGSTITRVIEAGQGEPLVLLHGVGARADRWMRNIPGLTNAGFHVFALDFPGHGFATKGQNQPASVPAYADFVEAFIAKKNFGPTVLIGTSLGGHVAATVSVRRPDLVRALVLVGTVGIVPVGQDRRERTGTRLRQTSLEAIETKLRGLIHDDTRFVTDEWIREEHSINTSPGAADSLEQIGEYFRLHLDSDLVGAELAALVHQLPVLLVWGTHDVAFPPEMALACQALLGGQIPLVFLENTGHAPYLERPDTFNKVITDFLAARNVDTTATSTPMRTV
ncbi:MAG: alpha/beta hydrolase [Ilumatobacteraceae bacterium]